jgi:hypothetical protein
MLPKHVLFIAIVLQISCALSAPVNNDDESASEERQEWQPWRFRRPSKYQSNLRKQSSRLLGSAKNGNDLRINRQYQYNDHVRYAPYVDYNQRQGMNRAGYRAEYGWNENVSDNAHEQVNQF